MAGSFAATNVDNLVLMVVLWVALAWRVSEQPALARRIEHLGEKLVPWIMIVAGTYILLDTGTDTYYLLDTGTGD